MSEARLFVALEIGEEDRLAFVRWAQGAVGSDAAMRIVEAELVHLTVAFLGLRRLAEVPHLATLVANVAQRTAPMPLETAGALWLSPRRPHVLTVAVADRTGALRTLHEELWKGLEALGHVRERRMFRPHVTVARVRRGEAAPDGRLPALEGRPVRSTALVLLRSWLGAGPARHEALARAEFGAET